MRIQICPSLMDWLLFLVMFAVLYAAGERQLSVTECAWLGAMPNITYMLASPVLGAFLTRRNARQIMLVSTVACTVFGAYCLLVTSWWWLLAGMAAMGFAVTSFFNSFQTFMRGETVPGKLTATVGGYTLAWSVGSSAGFLSSGAAYKLGLPVLLLVNIAVGTTVLFILLRYRCRPHEEHSADEHVETGTANCRQVNPKYVWVGWCIIFSLTFIQRPIQNFLPAASAKAGIAPVYPGLILFGHMFIQGVCGWLMIRKRHWLYRRQPMLIAQTAAVLILGGIWLSDSFTAIAVGVPLLGIYTGFGYFLAVYYASNSGRRSFNIGVNECLVGCGSFIGMFVCDRWINFSGNENAMYLACALALGLILVAQLFIASPKSPG